MVKLSKRNQQILQYKIDNPDASYLDIARIFKLSKQRIWCIIAYQKKIDAGAVRPGENK